jgi:hypothetical protein
MNNTDQIKNSNTQENEPKTNEAIRGLANKDRHLRKRANKVNYNILDHGDSSYLSEEEQFSDGYEGQKKKGKKRGQAGKFGVSKDKIPFISKTAQEKKNSNAISEFAIRIEEDGDVEKPADEIDNLVSDLATRPKARRPKVLIEAQNEPIDQVIDLSELKTGKVSNSQLLLALIEICMNAKKYGINLLNKSRVFWDEVYNQKDFENIFKNFKAETLRKYWRIISEIGDLQGVINTIKSFEDVINQENAK